MSHQTNGTNITQTQWNAQDDRITNLENCAINTGGTVGSATLTQNMKGAEYSGTITGSGGSVIITHGCGWTPQNVIVQMRGNPNVAGTGPYGTTYVSNITSTQFTVYIGNTFSSGSWSPAATGQSVVFDWTAYKDLS